MPDVPAVSVCPTDTVPLIVGAPVAGLFGGGAVVPLIAMRDYIAGGGMDPATGDIGVKQVLDRPAGERAGVLVAGRGRV